MRKTKRILSILLMLTMLVTVFGGLTAFAADSDPNMTAFNGQYTYVVNRTSIPLSGTTVPIYVIPADSGFNPTYFDTAAAAAAVTWTRFNGSTSGITAGAVSAYQIAADQYASCLTVNLSGTVGHGPASFRAMNSYGGYVDITVVVTVSSYNDWQYYYTGAVDCQIYDPDGNLYENTANTICAANHSDARSYVTVFDGLVEMQDMDLIDSFAESYGYISSITIDGTPYAASGVNGWQFRVYDYNTSTQQYTIIPLSKVLGAGDMDMSVFNLIQWRYGSYYDTTLFPDTIS